MELPLPRCPVAGCPFLTEMQLCEAHAIQFINNRARQRNALIRAFDLAKHPVRRQVILAAIVTE